LRGVFAQGATVFAGGIKAKSALIPQQRQEIKSLRAFMNSRTEPRAKKNIEKTGVFLSKLLPESAYETIMFFEM
jgi:hypothetical protein